MATVLFVVPPERFRDEELFDTRSVIEAAGYDPRLDLVDSPGTGPVATGPDGTATATGGLVATGGTGG